MKLVDDMEYLETGDEEPKTKGVAGQIVRVILILLIFTVVAWFLLNFLTKLLENKKDDPETITYTQEEMDELVAKMESEADLKADEAAHLARQEVLSDIKVSLEEGNTYVETLRPLYPDDIVIVSNGGFYFLPIRDDLKKNSFTEENLVISEDGIFSYTDGEKTITHKGIDVSKFQGDKIDWNEVASDGVEFAILRAGLRGYGSGKLVEDETFKDNAKNAAAAGIHVGAYFFTQAINEDEVKEEAQMLFDLLEGCDITAPVVVDVEKINDDTARMNALTPSERTDLVIKFCEMIENAGYKPMIYHNMEMSLIMLEMERLEQYDKWFAYYNPNFYYPYEYKVWQYSEKGKVKGIKEPVDLNISFEEIW
ncbi:MAG: glycoside hydrolase family 25 protein [Acetatifactor sp.]|nr:glycoside hydrolase family 25 protein [Acetatifactor sp.]